MRTTILALILLFAAYPATAATPCEQLAMLALPNAKIDSATMVAAGTFTPPAATANTANVYGNLPAFCRVTATLTPSSDSDIKTEIWLPATGWNGKFQAVGNGGWAGTIPYAAIAAAIRAGYVGAGTVPIPVMLEAMPTSRSVILKRSSIWLTDPFMR
jgi:feruloyl esterase